MCYSDRARPPLPPIRGAAEDHGDIRLTAADGNDFAAYEARAARPSGRAMVILPDVRGLHPFYKELAVRFAEAGIDAVAIDYFGRSAPNDDRGESFEYKPHVDRTTPEMVAQDARAAVEYVRHGANRRVRAIFTVGFCWGGALSWRQSAAGHDLAGCIGFYGGRPMTRVAPVIPRMRAPLLMLLAGVDSTPPEEFEEFADAVRRQGIEVEVHTYAGAPHSFFDRTFTAHRKACDDAWRRILDFTARFTPVAA
ncbi:MAG TPA: dienelactone hydrolase family protein [Candidatus Dormibacteraeota bacterium]|nr:dienelactone hydrolase family protein [Candidatus Dormibacteraeota bacterium]